MRPPKRNFFKVPKAILESIERFDQDDIVVACVKLLRPEDVARYAHLGMAVANGQLQLPGPAVPRPTMGRWSRANVEGYKKKRRDLPKVPKSYTQERPNWGDSSRGTHDVVTTRMVYPIDFYPPKEVELSLTQLPYQGDGYLVKFAIEQVINRRTPQFADELFYNLNILQENAAGVDVFKSDATLADFVASVRVDWQFFPPGTVDDVVQRMLRGKKNVSPQLIETVTERVTVMKELSPKQYITGTDGFLRYFGAQFDDDLVAFENAHYGNALYVMHENWEELSKRSRVDLLRGPRDSFDRIEHRKGWQKQLEYAVKKYRKND